MGTAQYRFRKILQSTDRIARTGLNGLHMGYFGRSILFKFIAPVDALSTALANTARTEIRRYAGYLYSPFWQRNRRPGLPHHSNAVFLVVTLPSIR